METKRVTLYLNLEDDRDLEIWNFIKDQKKKPAYIKSILYSLSKNLEKVVPATKKDHREVKEIELDESELNDIDGF